MFAFRAIPHLDSLPILMQHIHDLQPATWLAPGAVHDYDPKDGPPRPLPPRPRVVNVNGLPAINKPPELFQFVSNVEALASI